jgi:hypothetical protein
VVVTVSGVPSNGVEFAVPVINAITPTSGPVGTLVTIIGSGFGATQGSGVVAIDGTAMQVVNWNDAEIQAAVATGMTALIRTRRLRKAKPCRTTRRYTCAQGGGVKPEEFDPQ